MIEQLTGVSENIVAFRALKEVTREDFDKIVLPAVDTVVERTGELNFLLIVDTPLKNFTIGAWWKDAILGVKHLSKWNRVAILTDSEGIQWFTNAFSKVMPGDFKGYDKAQLREAIEWVSMGK